ncbi:hypothetical protein D3C85_683340 [compost metagenome]
MNSPPTLPWVSARILPARSSRVLGLSGPTRVTSTVGLVSIDRVNSKSSSRLELRPIPANTSTSPLLIAFIISATDCIDRMSNCRPVRRLIFASTSTPMPRNLPSLSMKVIGGIFSLIATLTRGCRSSQRCSATLNCNDCVPGIDTPLAPHRRRMFICSLAVIADRALLTMRSNAGLSRAMAKAKRPDSRGEKSASCTLFR